MLALSKELPDILIFEVSERGDFQFEEMVLRWVQVNSVYSLWPFEAVAQDVVASARDSSPSLHLPT